MSTFLATVVMVRESVDVIIVISAVPIHVHVCFAVLLDAVIKWHCHQLAEWCSQLERQLQSTQQQMKDAEDEYEKAEKRLQEQLHETKEQLSAAQRVLLKL